ncbi:dnaJ homolog subfamily C member 1-like [Anneissia japonica]|uniref:dnaJ homolog subfamily C member 1-like n=1 Tax=Anneissia japonica TaxID=1529436 RepID=UPI0014256372|nr:dnaJ homolog subfamily C member 1-like [Anneissia japonica]
MVPQRVYLTVICIVMMKLSCSLAWDNEELELFDLVEEILPQTFYDFLGIEQTATSSDVRKAYRKLSLQYHPDKNQEEGTEEKFRKIVAVVEVLKNEGLRQRYNEILEFGLPTWREPVYYFRKVRKMGLLEISVLVSVIMTVGHYIVAWAAFWEKRFEMECLMPKKKKDKKSRKTKNQDEEEEVTVSEEMLANFNISRPKLTDLLPVKLTSLFISQLMHVPSMFNTLKVCLQERTRQLPEENESEEPEEIRKPKRRVRVETAPVAEPIPMSSGNGPVIYNAVQNGVIENQEVKHVSESRMGMEWTADDVTKMVRCMAKYPGGTTERWQKIAAELDRSVDEVLKKSKSMKSGSYAMNVDASVQGIVKGTNSSVTSKSGKRLNEEEISVRSDFKSENSEDNRRHKTAKPVKSAERTLLIQDIKADSNKAVNVNDEEVWTQAQQKVFEKALAMFPKGTSDRFNKVAEQVPGKSREQCILRYKDLVEMVRKKKLTSAS